MAMARWKSKWLRVWRKYLRPVVGIFPLTRAAVSLALLYGVALWFQGVLHLDLVLLVAGLAGLLVLVTGLLFTLIGAVWLMRRAWKPRTPGVLDLETQVLQATGFSVRFPARIPFIVSSWQWVSDGGPETAAKVELERMGGVLQESVAPARRGMVRRIIRKFVVRDLFGLAEVSWRRAEEVSLRILPHRGRLAEMPPPAGLADGDDLEDPFAEPRGDRVEMRQYAPGDPIRMVLWKVFARSGKMMVRTPERSVAERRKGCAYLVTGKEDDATAAVARVAVERGLFGEDWCFGAEGVEQEARDDREAALEIIARSGEAVAAENTEALARFVGRMEAEGYQFCIVFVPPERESWARVAAQSIQSVSMRLQILTGVELLDAELAPADGWQPRMERWLLKPRAAGGVTLETIVSLAGLPGILSQRVSVAERETGHLHDDILGWRG